MNIIVTGSTGFVGSHLVPLLISKGHHVLELTIDPEISELLYGNQTKKHTITENQESLRESVVDFKPDAVIHLAAYLTSHDDYASLQKLLDTNIVFYCRLLDCLKNTNIKIFINTGTFAEYSHGDGKLDPAYLYSATKTASRIFLDYYSKIYSFKQTTVVPYTIYGGKDSQKKIIDIIYDSISCINPTDLSPGEQVLDFIHIEDVANFYTTILENIDQLPHTANFQLGTGVGHNLKQLASLIEELTGKKTNINWGGRPYRPGDIMYAVADISDQKSLLDWKPSVAIKEGITRFIKSK